jgi:hypothetical protein
VCEKQEDTFGQSIKHRDCKEINITPILDKIQEYKRNWLQHANTMPHNRLLRILKNYRPMCRRNHRRPLQRLLDA